MKACPKCSTQYADDTLSFCLEDGTPLRALHHGDMPTAILTDEEVITSVRIAGRTSDPRFQDSQVTSVGSLGAVSPNSEPRKGSTAATIALTAGGMTMLFAIVVLVGYIFYQNSDRPVISNIEPNKNTAAQKTDNSVTLPAASPSAITVPVNASTPTAVPTKVMDIPAIRNEVMKEIYGSKSARESRDLSSYMSYYAETLDRYYTKRGMSRAGVRADKARHFANYTSMQSEYSNMNVAVASDGQSATAVFDKEWNFSGAKTSSGKVQSELIYKRINNRWLITSERDLKVYYTR